jgi:SAM-dependent methyltransferase
MASESTLETPLEAERPSSRSNRRPQYIDLFLISFLILFFELACIRWFGGTVVFMTFFTNIVLIACFLGMSVGCLAASRRTNYVGWVLPLGLVLIVASYAVLAVHRSFGRLLIDVGGQGSPRQIFFGTEFRANDPSVFVVPIEVVAGTFFVLIALLFVGLGQVMGRAFDAIPNHVAAYTTNVLASLVGILVFALMSWFRQPPALWFAVAAVITLRFVPRWTTLQILSAYAIVTVLAVVASFEGSHRITIWSPYYKIYYNPKAGSMSTNNIAHQAMTKIGDSGAAYMLPHLLNRDTRGQPFDEVMIIGAGSGNDVAAALAGHASHVDAVEIEPVLNEIGRADHPLKPYDDPRVTIHLDDGRSFARKTSNVYDLVEYALVDSLVLHSGYSSLRLESFLFTEQAFRDIKDRLKPDGVFVMYNYFRQGWIAGRLEKMAENVFGTKPIIISLPYREEIKPGKALGSGFTFLLVGKPGSKPLETIRQKLESSPFWLSERPLDNEPINAFSQKPPDIPGVESSRWQKIGMSRVEASELGPLPTDDWPFLYLRSAAIPWLNLRGMALIAILSLVVLLCFAPVRTFRPNGQMFFLGAGFMLLETKGVVHMALLFGSTWIVNSVVFGAILVMILLSNLFVIAFKPRSLAPFYVLLIIALLANAYVPMSLFLSLPGASKIAASCTMVFLPVFFAGVIFATAFRDSQHPDLDFGSNIGGVILGALSENVSLIVGFNHLLLLAVAYYMLSWLLFIPALQIAHRK